MVALLGFILQNSYLPTVHGNPLKMKSILAKWSQMRMWSFVQLDTLFLPRPNPGYVPFCKPHDLRTHEKGLR